MKKVFLLFAICFTLQINANPTLIKVNQEWLNQLDINLSSYANIPSSELEAIQMHLKLVEKTLRSRDVSHLSASQKVNRTKCLNILKKYWIKKVFPQNEEFSYRTPIFIDKYNTFCAVGYLMKKSGFEGIAREISEENNLVYVRDISNPNARAWMDWAGLTMEECAWIQPSYGNPTDFKRCGKGTIGNVCAMQAINNELVVGGDFTKVDSTINSSGLAKWKKQGSSYIWEDFSAGIPPNTTRFKAVAFYKGKYWAGGENLTAPNDYTKNNLYCFDGMQWQVVTQIKGDIRDITVYKNELYICGILRRSQFDWYKMAKLDTSQNQWVDVYNAGSEHTWINKMKVLNDKLIVAGNIWINGSQNIATFDGQNFDYQSFYLGVPNEVMDFDEYQGKLYIGGLVNGSVSSYTMRYYTGNYWLDTNSLSLNRAKTINVVKSLKGSLFWAGNFHRPGMMYSAKNLCNNNNANGWGFLDSTVTCMEEFDGNIYIAGLFKNDITKNSLNHISYFSREAVGVDDLSLKKEQIVIYPNPVIHAINIESNVKIASYEILNIAGKRIRAEQLKRNEIDVSILSDGLYLIGLTDKDGQKVYKKFIKD